MTDFTHKLHTLLLRVCEEVLGPAKRAFNNTGQFQKQCVKYTQSVQQPYFKYQFKIRLLRVCPSISHITFGKGRI